MTGEWFATDEDDEIDEVQQAVINVLRARAHSDAWPAIHPDDTNVALPDYLTYGYPAQPDESTFGKVLAWLDVTDPVRRQVLLTVGVQARR